MRPTGTDAIGILRWGLRRYLPLFLSCLLLGAVLAPYWVLNRRPPLEATALVIAQRLDMDLSALPRYGEAVFGNGQVAQAVAAKFGRLGDHKNVIPSRVSLVAEQDSIVLQVVGHDTDPQTAADVANTAAATFLEALNAPGVGVGAFVLHRPADPPVNRAAGLDTLVATGFGLAAGAVLGLAAVSLLLVVRRPVIGDADTAEATGVPSLGTVTVPRARTAREVRPSEFAGLVPVCRRILALPTPTVVLVSRPRQERVRRQLSVALAGVLGRVRDVRYIGDPEAQLMVEARAGSNGKGPRGSDLDAPAPLTVIDSSEPLDLVQPPHLTATVLVVPVGIAGSALRAAVVEHLGGSAEARVLLVKRGRRPRRPSTTDLGVGDQPERREAVPALEG
jgi:capsular polysaccharide biosynthesis protein